MSPPYPNSSAHNMAIPDANHYPSGPKPYAHISDLKEKAIAGLSKNQSVRLLHSSSDAF